MVGKLGSKWQPWLQDQEAESSHHQAESGQEVRQDYGRSQPAPRDVLPPARLYLPNAQRPLPPNCHQMGTRGSNPGVYGDWSPSHHHSLHCGLHSCLVFVANEMREGVIAFEEGVQASLLWLVLSTVF